MAELIQKKLQGEVEKYQQLQKDLSKSMSGRQKLEAQLTENNIVKEELALLDGSNVVFKLLGPVLVKQELGEARATVGKRLDYITAEIKRYESQLRDLERQKELRAQEDPEEALSGALSDRDEAVNKALELSLELSRVSLERDSLSRELLRTIRQKVALTQELEAWQDDMQVVIGQQLRSQRQKELSAAGSAPRRAAPRFSLRLSNLFRRT